MSNRFSAVALALASLMSSAAIAAPRDYSGVGIEQPGAWFNCVIPYPGPKGFRTGGCWLDGAIQG